MKSVLNFTDRDDHISKSGLNAEIQIHVQDKNSNTIYTPEINIKKDYRFIVFNGRIWWSRSLQND